MSKGIFETIGGALAITAGAVTEYFAPGNPIGSLLINAGAGLVISGIGTMIAGSQVKGFATTLRDPISPWEIVVGETRVGGTLVYTTTFGENNRFLDMVIVLAAHPSQAVNEVLFDGQRLQIGANNSSFTPVQQTVNIHLTTDITRTPNAQGNSQVVQVVLSLSNIPLLSDGDFVVVQGVEPVATLMNGKFQVTVLNRTTSPGAGSITFTYLSGGPPTSGPGAVPVTASGQVVTQWQNYGANVYCETINDSGPYNLIGYTVPGGGSTFRGMIYGTPLQGDFGNGTIQNAANYPNPWTGYCSLVGFTAVFLRLQYNSSFFPGGIPQISFIMQGKCDILDPRTSPPTTAYTENAALIIADYLYNSTWGFNTPYSQINTAQLISAANTCDEQVPIANPYTSPYTTEARYTCNGRFKLNLRRGEVLQNLLTSCAGRITYVSGQWFIYPAIWAGSSLTVPSSWINTNSTSPIKWRPTVAINNRYNGVKGTYISQTNNWESADFPPYAQDVYHGYNDGNPPEYDVNLDYDEGQRRWKDIQLPFTTSSDTAQRLAKIELLRSLYMGTGTFSLNMTGYQIAPMDVLSVSWDYFGWDGQYLEVLAVRFKLDKVKQDGTDTEVTLLGVEIDVQETDPSVYDFELIEDLTPQGYTVPGVLNTIYTPDPPTNLEVAGGILTWTAPIDPYVVSIACRYQLVASPPGPWISLGTVPVSVTQLALPGLTSGVLFIIELESINVAGVTSQWTSITTVGLPIFQWNPRQIQAPSTDALFPGEWTFDLSQTYTPTSGTDWTAIATATGVQPPNSFIPGSTSPVITAANVFVSSTGGYIPGGVTLYLAIGACGSGSGTTASSTILSINIPSGTNTNKVTLGDAFASIIGTFTGNPADGNMLDIAGTMYTFGTGGVTIGANLPATIANLVAAINAGNPNCTAVASSTTTITCTASTAGSSGNSLTCSGIAATWSNQGTFAGGASISWGTTPGLRTWVIYAQINNEDLLCSQAYGTLTAVGSPPTGYTPTTGLTLTGPIVRSAYAVPSPIPNIVRLKGALLIHGGVEGAEVDELPTGSPPPCQIVAYECIDPANIDNWTGRAIAIIGRNNSSAPYVSFLCTAFDPTTGTFTFSEDPVAAGVEVGDAMVVCTLGVSNAGNEYVITDPGLSNAQDFPTPHAGLIPNDPVLLGTTVMVIAGTSRGMNAHIVSNTATSITLDAAIPIDSTSVWIVIGYGWPYLQNSQPINNPNYQLQVALPMQVDNAVGGSILVVGVTVDAGGVESLLADAPVRMLFVWGSGMAEIDVISGSTSPPTTSYQMLATDQIVYVDCTAAPVTVTLPDISVVRNSPRYIKKIDASSNVVTIMGFDGQTVENVATMTLSFQGAVVTLVPNE